MGVCGFEQGFMQGLDRVLGVCKAAGPFFRVFIWRAYKVHI